MRNLGEQWVEEIDGKEHMLKAVSNHTGTCKGCDLQVVEHCYGTCGADYGCNFIVKDLGILNADGCLPSSFGEYPTIAAPSEDNGEWCVYAFLNEGKKLIKDEEAWGETEQEAIDVWNRRA